ncbi:MAG: GntR family transcriptional regulator [Burkholderiales bacterium]|nr:GntR family transcriptional regulator [Burkholderiales bacterium]
MDLSRPKTASGSRDALQPGALLDGPLYLAVKRRIARSLMAGEWGQGESLPSEAQLAARYAVSPGTVRKAIGELVNEHILVRQAGRGTFAVSHDSDSMLEAYFHIVGDDGHKEFPASRMVSCRAVAADAAMAQQLHVARGAPLIQIENLLSLRGEVVIFDRIRVPRAVFPDFDVAAFRQRDTTIFRFYQLRHAVTVARLVERLRASNAGPRIARLLGVPVGEALLAIERLATTYDGTPVEFRDRHVSTRHHAYVNVLGMKGG